ncbi:MAG: S1-like domain-containing RNA-binding protein [Verrucomicrobiales bacterium]
MIEIGKTARLIILREADQGFYLDGENLGEILLPNRYVPVDLEQGDEITVFLYPDSEDRLVATTEEPLCEADEFAALRVVEVHPTIPRADDEGASRAIGGCASVS